MLLGLWAAEERRLGVVHDPDTGALANLERPLDGSDPQRRHRAALAVVTGPPPPSVASPPPSARALEEAASPGAGAEYAAAATDHAAFRTLRRALRAAELWRQADSTTFVGSLVGTVARLDVRHKIYAVLAGWNAAGVGAEDAVDAGSSNADGDQQQHPLGGGDAPPLEPPHRVALELVRSHEQAVVGSAWQVCAMYCVVCMLDAKVWASAAKELVIKQVAHPPPPVLAPCQDALDRLREAGVSPADEDLAELQSHVARVREGV
jgi:hypothetical protein